MNWIVALDLFGTAVFAISGVLTAMEKKFDLVGTLVIGFVTAIGGGTIRDILIGRQPVGWLNDVNYIMAACIGYIIAYSFRSKIIQWKKSMFLFDTIGIGLFTVIGINIGLSHDLNEISCLIMGVVSACFGGVVRDVLTTEVPLIFREQIYATACFVGGALYLVLSKYNPSDNFNIMASMALVILIRYLSVRNNWTLNFSGKA